jgi:hypothetical protein
MQIVIGVFVIAINVALYWAAFRRKRSRAPRARP